MYSKASFCRMLLLMACLLALCRVSKSSGIFKTVTLSGYVHDMNTGETLTGAVIYPKDKTDAGIVTNAYGFFSLSLPAGVYAVVIQYLGYKTQTIQLEIFDNKTISINMVPESVTLKEVIVTGVKNNRNVVSTDVLTKMDIKEIQNIPVLFGEKDIFKTIQLLPGITAAGEGNSGFYVRGGGADQNLILLDEAPVYNPSHLLGFFSTFTSDAIKDITVYKGGFPAEYGGRLSSVVDVKMNEGNNKEYHVSGGIGLISSDIFPAFKSNLWFTLFFIQFHWTRYYLHL